MFFQIYCFFLISCLYTQINCAPGMPRDEDSDFTLPTDTIEKNIQDEYHEAKDVVDTTLDDAKRSFNDNYKRGKDKAEEIADNVQRTLEGEHRKQVDLLQNVADKVKHDTSSFVEGTKNIANKVYESGMDAFKNTRESVRNSLDKSLQSTGEFFDAGLKTSKDNLATLLTIVKTPFQQTTNFVDKILKI